MTSQRNKLYLLIFVACMAGYSWLYYSLTNNSLTNGSVEVCLLKNITNIPCPSCGSTRSIISLIKGNFREALSINPIGFIVAFIMVISPIWITTDVLTKKNTLLDFYKTIEIYLKKPKYTIPLLVILIINWIWNITKGL